MCVFFEIHRDSTNPIFLPSPNVYVPLKFDAGIQGPAEGFPLIFARRSIARKIGSFILCVRSLNICYENERLRELQSRPADYLPNFEYWELTVNRRRRVKFAQGSFLHPLCKRSINVLQVTFDLTRNLKSAGGKEIIFCSLRFFYTEIFVSLLRRASLSLQRGGFIGVGRGVRSMERDARGVWKMKSASSRFDREKEWKNKRDRGGGRDLD